jgi:uncharacterized iron-regulated protein
MKRLALLTLSIAIAAACGTTKPVEPDPEAKIVAAKTGRSVTLIDALSDADDAKVVYLGEQHNNDYMHEFQLEAVLEMHRRDPRLVIGMEMFQRPYQPALDAFIAGEIDEREMLVRTEYFTRWGWDWHYYRPILMFAREKGLPVIALNAPKETTRKVARNGLEGLTEEERAGIAMEIDTGIEAHREYVKSIWDAHPMPPGMSFDNFYAAQCVWEDTMAESVANGLAAHPGSRMAVIVGQGHVRQRFGIPMRADVRGAAPSTIFYGLTEGERDGIPELIEGDWADWFYVTPKAPKNPPTPRLGFMPDMARMKDGLFVARVTKGTLAALAGVKGGDQIVEMDGIELKGLADLKLALALDGKDKGTIVVLREGERVPLTYDRRWVRK